MTTTVANGFDLISIGKHSTVGRDAVISAAFIEPTDCLSGSGDSHSNRHHNMVMTFAPVHIADHVSISDQAAVFKNVALDSVSTVGAATLLLPDMSLPRGAFIQGAPAVKYVPAARALHCTTPTDVMATKELASLRQLPHEMISTIRSVSSDKPAQHLPSGVLITGATGFVGRHVVAELLTKDYGKDAVTGERPTVHVVIRAHHDAHARKRMLQAFSEAQIPLSRKALERLQVMTSSLYCRHYLLVNESDGVGLWHSSPDQHCLTSHVLGTAAITVIQMTRHDSTDTSRLRCLQHRYRRHSV